MKRYEQDRKIRDRNHKEHLKSVHGWPKKPVDCVCDLQAGRFRKKDAYDCGNTLCRICHYDKWLHGGHSETRQEKLSNLKMKEGQEESQE